MGPACLCRLILHVRDPGTLAAWYVATFDWRIVVDERTDGWIELDAGGFTLALHAGARSVPGHWPKLQIRVPQVAAAKAALALRGLALGEIQEWKGLAWAEGADPEGNTIQIVNR
jgi:catechol 2,3-dioxygenase-like lactoylglutathione lyase family enzyme